MADTKRGHGYHYILLEGRGVEKAWNHREGQLRPTADRATVISPACDSQPSMIIAKYQSSLTLIAKCGWK